MTVADRLTVMATGAAVAVSIVGGSCSTNARIGDTRAAIRELRLDMRAEHDTLRADLRAEHDSLRGEIRGLADRVRAIEISLGGQNPGAPPAGMSNMPPARPPSPRRSAERSSPDSNPVEPR